MTGNRTNAIKALVILFRSLKHKHLTVRQSEIGTIIKYRPNSLRTLVLDFRRGKVGGHWNR